MFFTKKNRFITISASALILVVLFVVSIFGWLYKVAQQNIIGKWQTDTFQFAQRVNHYLRMSEDAVAFSAETLNDMLSNGKSHEEALAYLKSETEIYASVISDNETGVYSYFRGKYLDGSGWDAPSDYEPKSRPWYTAAIGSHGKIALAEPYMNMQTHKMMMSVSRLLADDESVVSMDIFLDGIQEMAEDAVQMGEVNAVIVLNENNFVIAHSDKNLVGTFLSDTDFPLKADETPYKVVLDGKECTVFSQNISGGWKTVFVLANRTLYSAMTKVYVISSVAILVAMVAVFFVFGLIVRKYEESEMLSQELQAIADIYEAVVKINLKKSVLNQIQRSPLSNSFFPGTLAEFKTNYKSIVEKISAEQSHEILKNFLDFSTLEERLSGVKSISQEFMDSNNRWVRLRFIVVNRNEENALENLILAFESIDEDKKRQEKLRRRAETDMMTGVRNRGSGEALIKKAMAEGRSGMFCLLDADKFKSINDTFGHSVGDKVICAIAEAMKKTFRGSDIVFRLGGDEFAAYSEGVASEEIGLKIMERLFNNINGIDIPELKDRKISLSVGASFYPATHEDSFEAMYKRADSGTYESKKHEGNAFTFRADES